MEERNETRETEETPSNELDGNLSQFVLAARTKPRKECEPSSLRGVLSSHERRLSRQCIFKDSEFKKIVQRCIKGQTKKELKRHEYGN